MVTGKRPGAHAWQMDQIRANRGQHISLFKRYLQSPHQERDHFTAGHAKCLVGFHTIAGGDPARIVFQPGATDLHSFYQIDLDGDFRLRFESDHADFTIAHRRVNVPERKVCSD